jgi:hypothetical protein
MTSSDAVRSARRSANRALCYLLVLNALVLIGTLIGAWLRPPTGRSHFGEETVITLLSAALLLAVSVLCFMTYRAARVSRGRATFWLLAAMGTLFLVCDELFLIHENADRWIHTALDLRETPLTDSIDDALVAAYLLGALVVMGYYRHYLTKFRPALPYFIGGFVFAGLMVVLDVTSNNQWTFSSALLQIVLSDLEEVCKVTAGACFVAGAYCCYKLVKLSAAAGDGN